MGVSAMPVFAFVTISLKIFPLTCHRLITNPYPGQEWDSVVVSSDPITIREKTHNDTTSVKQNQILRPQKRSYEQCSENDFACLYGSNDGNNRNDEIVEKFIKQYSQIADVTFAEDGIEEKEDKNSRKSFWTMVNSQTYHHPYDDKKGWVTLDPVPWSTSKISKWQPNKMGGQQESPSVYGYPVQQLWISGSRFHPHRPNAQWGIGTNDIITDSKPNDFPMPQYHGYVSQDSHHQGSNNQVQDNHEIKGTNPVEFPQSTHPSTYPSNGNGEWVLLSTTKGYSNSRNHRWSGQKDLEKNERFSGSRKINPVEISKYQEEDLTEKFILAGEDGGGNRKSDTNEAEESAQDNNSHSFEKGPVQVLYTGTPKDGEQEKTTRRTVKLQVLPSLETSSISYKEFLEVDPNSHAVDEVHQGDAKLKKLTAVTSVKKTKTRGYKLVPTFKATGKGINHKKVVALAAVGAGMIPATMALLAPMALGRKKRSVSLINSASNRALNWGKS